MKTLKFFIVLCFIATFTVNPIKAQNRVVKTEFTLNVDGMTFPCLDDYLGGDIVFESMNMSHNWIMKLKKATILGYLDAGGTIPSGNVYEVSQVAPGLSFSEWNLQFRLNGKLIAEIHMSWHMTINANGDITAVIDNTVANCFN
jgi:hypothetical protein